MEQENQLTQHHSKENMIKYNLPFRCILDKIPFPNDVKIILEDDEADDNEKKEYSWLDKKNKIITLNNNKDIFVNKPFSNINNIDHKNIFKNPINFNLFKNNNCYKSNNYHREFDLAAELDTVSNFTRHIGGYLAGSTFTNEGFDFVFINSTPGGEIEYVLKRRLDSYGIAMSKFSNSYTGDSEIKWDHESVDTSARVEIFDGVSHTGDIRLELNSLIKRVPGSYPHGLSLVYSKYIPKVEILESDYKEPFILHNYDNNYMLNCNPVEEQYIKNNKYYKNKHIKEIRETIVASSILALVSGNKNLSYVQNLPEFYSRFANDYIILLGSHFEEVFLVRPVIHPKYKPGGYVIFKTLKKDNINKTVNILNKALKNSINGNKIITSFLQNLDGYKNITDEINKMNIDYEKNIMKSLNFSKYKNNIFNNSEINKKDIDMSNFKFLLNISAL